jgi:hypothetical protein
MLTRSGLLAGAAAMALSGAAFAQDIGADAPADNRTAEGMIINPDANAAAPAVADGAAPLTDADIEGPEAAIVEEEIDEANAEAVRTVLDAAQDEALQNEVHILPTRTNEDEIRPWHLWAGEDEGAGVRDMRAFMALDLDGDLLLTPSEWDAAAPGRADFSALDINFSGQAGFAEYRVWLALQAAEAANDNAAAVGGPLETPDEPAAAPPPAPEAQ